MVRQRALAKQFMRQIRYSARADPNETPEQRDARLERVRRLREGFEPIAERTRIGSYPCGCGARMAVYEGDARAHGWLRGECPACGAWRDVDPAERDGVTGPAQ